MKAVKPSRPGEDMQGLLFIADLTESATLGGLGYGLRWEDNPSVG